MSRLPEDDVEAIRRSRCDALEEARVPGVAKTSLTMANWRPTSCEGVGTAARKTGIAVTWRKIEPPTVANVAVIGRFGEVAVALGSQRDIFACSKCRLQFGTVARAFGAAVRVDTR